jgi:son of sevenless-like protein
VLRNFETVVEILSGIEMSPISRLKLTWSFVSEKAETKLAQLRNLFDPQENWKVYRTELASVIPPAIPYIGIFLQMLTFAEDGNDTWTPSKLLNWQKFEIIAGIVDDIRKYKSKPFRFTEVPDIQVR